MWKMQPTGEKRRTYETEERQMQTWQRSTEMDFTYREWKRSRRRRKMRTNEYSMSRYETKKCEKTKHRQNTQRQAIKAEETESQEPPAQTNRETETE